MSERQYIGARYVPKFYENSLGGAEWTSNTQYEPLTIVTRNGNSYTSKKPVPSNIGAPEDNGEYWVSTGIYNEQIETYRAEVEAIEPVVTKLNNNINGKYIFIADSYGMSEYGNWCYYLAQCLGLSASDYHSVIVSGGSLYAGNLLSNLTAYANTLSSDEKDGVGKVVYLGGINDAHTDASTGDFANVKTGLSDLCTYVKNNFTNATFYIGYIGNSRSDSAILNGRSWENIAESFSIYSKCGEYGAVFLNNLEIVMHDYSLFRTDGIHPTLNGGQEIAKYAANAIKCGSCNIYRNMHLNTAALIGSYWDTTDGVDEDISHIYFLSPQFANFMMMYAQHNNIEYVQWKFRLSLIFDEAKTIAANGTLLLGKISYPYFQPKPGDMFPITGRAKLSDDSYINIKAHLLFNASQVYLRFDEFDANWSTPSSIEVTQILLNPESWCLPTMLC